MVVDVKDSPAVKTFLAARGIRASCDRIAKAPKVFCTPMSVAVQMGITPEMKQAPPPAMEPSTCVVDDDEDDQVGDDA